jgi:hypothetical protein
MLKNYEHTDSKQEEHIYSEELGNDDIYSEADFISSEEERTEQLEDADEKNEEEEEENYLEYAENEDDNKNEGWHVGPWSNCSAACGKGVRIR